MNVEQFISYMRLSGCVREWNVNKYAKYFTAVIVKDEFTAVFSGYVEDDEYNYRDGRIYSGAGINKQVFDSAPSFERVKKVFGV